MHHLIARFLIVTYVIFITVIGPMEWCLNGDCTINTQPGLCVNSSTTASSNISKTTGCNDCGEENTHDEDSCKRIDDIHQSDGPLSDVSPVIIDTTNTVIAFIDFLEGNAITCWYSYAHNHIPAHTWTQIKNKTVLHI